MKANGKRFFISPAVPLSLDLDLFTNEKQLDWDAVNKTVLRIGEGNGWKIVKQVSAKDFLQYIYADMKGNELKVDVVHDVPVHFGDIRLDGTVRIDALENIGSNKVTAIYGRTDAKDFIDLYWILTNTPMSFEHLFELAKKKDLGIHELYYSYALHNIDHIELFPTMLVPFDWMEIKKFFIEYSEKMMKDIKPE